MSTMVLIFILASMVFFIVLSFVKAWRYSHYPIHSRLELYPVPKEGKERAEYGGSYFEQAEWWKKPRIIDKGNETKDILKEMLFINKLFKNQRSLWGPSLCFHWGVYVLAGWTVLLLLATLLPVKPLIILTMFIGGFGFALATLGTLLLLVRRLSDSSLRVYTTPQEFFNLLLILVVLTTGIMCWAGELTPYAVARSLLFLDDTALSPFIITHIVLLGIMLIYIPLSKMSHYVGKFFAFHKVLWDNDPNQQGSQVNAQLKKSQAEPPKTTWSAPHVNPIQAGSTGAGPSNDSSEQ